MTAAVAVAGLLSLVAPWGVGGAPFAEANGTVCGPAGARGSAIGADASAPLDARRALWLVRRATDDAPPCVAAAGSTAVPTPADVGGAPRWVGLDWAVVVPLSDDDACAAGRPACGPHALPRARVVLADAAGVQAVVVDADGRVTPDSMDPARDLPPAVPTIERPAPGTVVRAPLVVRGVATGDWYFEGDLPLSVVDATGATVVRGVAVAQGPWMTSDPVPFEAAFDALPAPASAPLALVLERDDPSGIPWHGGALVVPVTAAAP